VAKGDKGDQGIAGETGPAGPAGPSSSGFYVRGSDESKYYLLRYPDLFWKDGTVSYLHPESGLIYPNIPSTPQPTDSIGLYYTTTHLTADCSDELFLYYYDPTQDGAAIIDPEVDDFFISLNNSEGSRWYKTTATLTDSSPLDFKSVHVKAGQLIWWEKDMPVAKNDICQSFPNYVDFLNANNALRDQPPLPEYILSQWSSTKLIVGALPAGFVKVGQLQHD
jgi:hypothetical protein